MAAVAPRDEREKERGRALVGRRTADCMSYWTVYLSTSFHSSTSPHSHKINEPAPEKSALAVKRGCKLSLGHRPPGTLLMPSLEACVSLSSPRTPPRISVLPSFRDFGKFKFAIGSDPFCRPISVHDKKNRHLPEILLFSSSVSPLSELPLYILLVSSRQTKTCKTRAREHRSSACSIFGYLDIF